MDWHYKALRQEMGPISFHELVTLVRTGVVKEHTQVRRGSSDQWERADAIIGLFRAARQTTEIPSDGRSQIEVIERSQSKVNVTGVSHTLPVDWSLVIRLAAALACGNLAVSGIDRWSAREALRFPDPTRMVSNYAFPGLGTCGENSYMLLQFGVLVVSGAVVYAIAWWLEKHAQPA